jgi:hypothetical protein
MSTPKLLSKLLEAIQYFLDSKYKNVVEEACKAWEGSDYASCEAILSKLPSSDVLLKGLVEKLRGKSVYTNLERVQSKDGELDWQALKVVSSLLTHVIIECERGNTEFRVLIPVLLEKLNNFGFDLLKQTG